jgi:hypothetical protein
MTRTDLHRLVDELPESAVSLAVRLLEAVREETDPLLRTLREAPEDDEPLTPEDETAINEGWDDVRAGRTSSLEQVKRELGL